MEKYSEKYKHMSPGEIILDVLDDRKIGQRDMAKMMGWSQSKLSRMLTGESPMTFRQFDLMVMKLGGYTLKILGEDEDGNPYRCARFDEIEYLIGGPKQPRGYEFEKDEWDFEHTTDWDISWDNPYAEWWRGLPWADSEQECDWGNEYEEQKKRRAAKYDKRDRARMEAYQAGYDDYMRAGEKVSI